MDRLFKNINIEIDGESHIFNFNYHELTGYGQACMITTGDYEAVIDEDFATITSNMPPGWLSVAVDKLRKILEEKSDG